VFVLPGSLIDRFLTTLTLLAPVVYLAADCLYAARGWADPIAAVVHVVGAIAYSFVVLRLVTWFGGRPAWALALLVVGLVGAAGNVAYGFNTIHVSLGDTDLVDATGAADLIKPLGLCFPLTLLLAAIALHRVGASPRWVPPLLGAASIAWPVAHIANIGWLAVLVNLALVLAFAALVSGARRSAGRPAYGSGSADLVQLGTGLHG